MSWSHRYGHDSDLLRGKQTTHAAQRTAKSTLTYELGTREFPFFFSFSLLYLDVETKEGRTDRAQSFTGKFPQPFLYLFTFILPLCKYSIPLSLNTNIFFFMYISCLYWNKSSHDYLFVYDFSFLSVHANIFVIFLSLIFYRLKYYFTMLYFPALLKLIL